MSKTNKQGQAIGRKGAQSRRRLLDAARTLLNIAPTDKLTASAIAREAGMASQTFYLYFQELNELLLVLSEEAGADTDSVIEPLNTPWPPESIRENCLQFIQQFDQYWRRNYAILAFRNFQADTGNVAFYKEREKTAIPIVEAISRKIMEANDGRPSGVTQRDAFARAVVIFAGIERLAARPDQLSLDNKKRVRTEELIQAEADILTLLFSPQAHIASPAQGRSPISPEHTTESVISSGS